MGERPVTATSENLLGRSMLPTPPTPCGSPARPAICAASTALVPALLRCQPCFGVNTTLVPSTSNATLLDADTTLVPTLPWCRHYLGANTTFSRYLTCLGRSCIDVAGCAVCSVVAVCVAARRFVSMLFRNLRSRTRTENLRRKISVSVQRNEVNALRY